MEKREMLEKYNRPEEKILLSQILDKIRFSAQRQKIETTQFLDMYQISYVKEFLRKLGFDNYLFFGGFEGAERQILIIYPEKYTIDMVEKNYDKMFKIIRVELPDEQKGKMVHRNYLGGIVKLGIKREKVGDIIVSNDGADIIVINDFADTLSKELSSLTRFQNSKITIENIAKIRKQEIKIEEVKIIVPSLRLDNVISDLARTSRNKAVQIIEAERVFVNGKSEVKVSKQIKQNDVITIRGKGRFIIKDFTGTTRSGRTIVLVEKYV